jgi:predicted MPP superfamily phosphohydrolase
VEFLLYLVVGCVIWATLIERFLFTIRYDDAFVLPKGSPDLVVLHISDVHMAPWQTSKQAFIKELASKIKPDLVINTGDNLGHKDGVKPVLESFKDLAVPGVYVYGSNDLYAPMVTNPLSYLMHPSERHRDNQPESVLDVEGLANGFIALGWQDLNNKESELVVKGVRLGFIGTDDPHEKRADIASITKAKAKLNSSDVLIGVTHAPYLNVLTAFSDVDADIVFAGHTHGGQVCWPVTGRALVTNCDLPTKYARGLNKITLKGKELLINVSAGLGHSIYAPMRFACRPEVRVITLKAKN